MDIAGHVLEDQIPFYLTREQKDGLLAALRDFPRRIDYYLNDGYPSEVLQGDVWSSLDTFNFNDSSRKSVKGMILSNSCDVSLGNERTIPPKLVFAPIIRMDAYRRLLSQTMSDKSIDDKFRDIRAQEITSIFYLPQGGGLDAEHLVFMDDVHSVPSDYFQNKGERAKQATLSLYGFYLFLFKLSVHFCRFHEQVAR